MKTISSALAATTASVALLFSQAPAVAGPNDQLTVATAGHIDSPKVYWDPSRNTFSLKSEFKGQELPVEETVNWFGKGNPDDGIQYVYQVADDPRLDFLGKPGDLLYLGPATPSGEYPIWLGFGADIGIPTEKFRDNSFTLDLVGFDGPGRMEQFNYSDADFPVLRLLSSHDAGRRSTWIAPGTHTHNATTFTKPGNYRLTYRASARTTDGAIVASEPQTVTWQVGGTQPSKSGLGDVRAAFDAAPATGSPMKSELRIAPGDEAAHLTDLIFSTGNTKDSGTAVFYIDGFYLAEVPVNAGTATWSEMIGSAQSNFQVVFVPDSSSESPRWVSSPVAYAATTGSASTTDEGTFPEPKTEDPAPAFDDAFKQLDDRSVLIHTQPYPVGESMVEISAVPADDRISFRVVGGYYDSETDEYPSCVFDFVSVPGKRSSIESRDFCDSPAGVLKMRLVPDSLTDAGATEFVHHLSESMEADGDAEFAVAAAAPVVPSTSSSTTPPATSTAAPSVEPTPMGLDVTRVQLGSGHIDLGPVLIDDAVRIALGDDTGLITKTHTLRDPGAVDIVIGDSARVDLAKQPKVVEKLPFLKAAGGEVWTLSQTQQQGLPWPGFSSEKLPDVDGKELEFELLPESMPDGAQWWAFTTGLGGLQEMLVNSTDKHSFTRTGAIHLHNNWVFSKPGTYTMQMRVRAIDGSFETPEAFVRFVVGEAAEPQPMPSELTTAAPAPSEPTTTVEPSPTTVTPAPSEAGGTQKPGSDNRLELLGWGLGAAALLPGILRLGHDDATTSSDSRGSAGANNPAHKDSMQHNPVKPDQQPEPKNGQKPAAHKANVDAKAGPAAQATSGKRGQLAATGANAMLLGGLAMLLLGAGFAAISLGMVRSRR
ncbi:actinobacterial surface-anchored protein domain [Corynebacterium epidermidicanis]|uniref:Actinobacterial surface-anchored protein domain n=1 Tax=Corynebacterium epidermidicanis TaxID=1050174 RepID=A0A0G3GRH5_9CORY|nr:actinobacterial surface-anchored protein domain [Corynebacterium epidermidicanis]